MKIKIGGIPAPILSAYMVIPKTMNIYFPKRYIVKVINKTVKLTLTAVFFLSAALNSLSLQERWILQKMGLI